MDESLASNPRKWWQLSRRLENKQSKSTPSLVRNGNIISDDHAKAKAFNYNFIECSTLDDSSANLPPNYNMLNQNKLEHLETRVGDVQKMSVSDGHHQSFLDPME